MATFDVILVRRTPQSGTAPTLVAVAPIKWSSLNVTRDCGAAGGIEVTGSVDNLDTGAKQSLIDLSSSPCELWCYRDAVLIQAGPLTNYKIAGRSIQFSAMGLLAYLSYMVRTSNYAVTATEQATIVKALIDDYQALTFGNYGLVTSTIVATGVTRDLTLLASDLKHVDQVVSEMGSRANGFDLDVDPVTRGVFLSSPRQGTDKSASIIIDGRSIGDPQYSQSVGPGQIASDVMVNSSSAASTTLTAPAADTGLRASFGRAMITASFSDVSVQATLDDHATRLVDNVSSPLHGVSPGLLTVPGFSWVDVDQGDIVAYQYDAGLGMQSFTPRIKSKRVSLDSGVERLSIGFF